MNVKSVCLSNTFRPYIRSSSGLKHVAQLEAQTLLSNKERCVEADFDLFIHILDTQWDVTRTNHHHEFNQTLSTTDFPLNMPISY